MVNKKNNLLFRFLITNYNNPRGDAILLWPFIPLYLIPLKFLGIKPLSCIIWIFILLIFDYLSSKWIDSFLKRNGVDGPDAANKCRKNYKLSTFTMVIIYLLLISITIVLFYFILKWIWI